MKAFTRLLVLVGVSLASIAGAQQSTTVATRSLVIWRPPATPGAPIVVFSQGSGGCATQSTFLTEALARHGYFVVAPNHKECRVFTRTWAGTRQLGRPAARAVPQARAMDRHLIRQSP